MGKKAAGLEQELLKQFKCKERTYRKWRLGQVLNQEYDSIAQLLRNKNHESPSPAGVQRSLGKNSTGMLIKREVQNIRGYVDALGVWGV